jgi:hypothetical protein
MFRAGKSKYLDRYDIYTKFDKRETSQITNFMELMAS